MSDPKATESVAGATPTGSMGTTLGGTTPMAHIDRGVKPLGGKAFGSIPHLPGSRMGPGDHHAEPGMARIACERVRDRHDRVIVQEKLDGSCTAVAKVDGEIVPLGRAGWPAASSKYEQHVLFHVWAMERADSFRAMLKDGERAVGEWLAQAHGTRYDLTGRDPWVMFDVILGPNTPKGYVPRASAETVALMGRTYGFATPPILNVGPWWPKPMSIADALRELQVEHRTRLVTDGADVDVETWRTIHGHYGALEPVEGAVWRIERNDPRDGFRVDLVKYVRPDKADGKYLPDTVESVNPGTEVWNWRP